MDQDEEETYEYMLHPFTHEVYRIPKIAMIYDHQEPLQMSYKSFEELAASTSFSAEHILARVKEPDQPLSANAIVVIEYGEEQPKVRSSIHVLGQQVSTWVAPPKRCIWAVRMCTEFPRTEAYRSQGLVVVLLLRNSLLSRGGANEAREGKAH